MRIPLSFTYDDVCFEVKLVDGFDEVAVNDLLHLFSRCTLGSVVCYTQQVLDLGFDTL